MEANHAWPRQSLADEAMMRLEVGRVDEGLALAREVRATAPRSGRDAITGLVLIPTAEAELGRERRGEALDALTRAGVEAQTLPSPLRGERMAPI